MTADTFRRAALALPGAIESEHMHHPDFRVANRIFATLGYPDGAWAMVKLPPEEQHKLLEAMPKVFQPAAGAWGRQGSTMVRLSEAKPQVLTYALEMAWRLAQAKPAKRKERLRPSA
ncbi:MAG TPA: MmcQ/YjbR family DNA-binding protein [Acidobacteriaceae bacterium]